MRKSAKKIKSSKIAAAVLSALIACAAAALFACSPQKETSVSEESTEQTTEASEETETEETETEETLPERTVIDVEEQTLIDDDACSVVLTGIGREGEDGIALELKVENKTNEETLVFSCEYALVEGLSMDPLWSCSVNPGAVSKEKVEFYSSEKYSGGIGFTDIRMMICVFDRDNPANILNRKYVRVYPYGQDAAAEYEREESRGDVVLIDNGSVKVTSVGESAGSDGAYTVTLYIENYTNSDLQFIIADAEINGVMTDPSWGCLIPAKGRGYSDVSWSAAALSENDISKVKSCTVTIVADVYDDFSSSPVARAQVELK